MRRHLTFSLTRVLNWDTLHLRIASIVRNTEELCPHITKKYMDFFPRINNVMSSLNCYFRFATNDDILIIYKWMMAQESREVGSSFLCNWSLTQEVHDEGGLIVAINKDEPIAYMWTNFGIVEVREDYRGNGVGRSLVEQALDYAIKSNAYCISIECAPQTSIPFWKHMGFKLYKEKYAYLILDKILTLPKKGEAIDVEISFYPEFKKWKPETTALEVFLPLAIKASNGIIYLADRVTIFADRSIWCGDPVLGIKISGNEVYLDKVKYQKARDIGVQYNNNSYAIEQMNA